MRVVLYAEGPAETRAIEAPPSFARRSVLAPEALGPAHVLGRRAIVHATGRDERSIRFEPPLLHRGRPATGSQLLDAKLLERLLTWADPKLEPDLAIVLVDADGDDSRRAGIERVIQQRRVHSPLALVAVAVQEFEAWLLADVKPWRTILGRVLDPLPDPESRKPGAAKQHWMSLVSLQQDDQHRVRLVLVSECDLDTVRRSCASFQRFLDDLRQATASIP